MASYDAAVFTAQAFVPPGIPRLPVHIIPPAIDPLSPKNMPLDDSLARRLVSWIGLDVDRPLVTQVSRFDRWKDPFGCRRRDPEVDSRGIRLVVSEALWKGTPVVATHAGGIPLQMASGEGGFLVHSTAECAERVLWLLENPAGARQIAGLGRDRVPSRYLLTRLIADDLRLYASAVSRGR